MGGELAGIRTHQLTSLKNADAWNRLSIGVYKVTCLKSLTRPGGLEPPTSGFGDRRSTN